VTLNEAVQIVAQKKPGNRLYAASLISSVCRFRLGMNYAETFEYIQKKEPDMSKRDWEALLYSLDMEYEL